MAISVEARTEIIALVVGMFGAAPGASVLSSLVASAEAGQTTAEIAANLANTAEFKSIYPTFLTNGEYATKVVANLLGEATAPAQAEAVVVLTAALNGGMSRSVAMTEAIKFVANTASTDTAFGTSAVAFDNKVEVATYYSVEKQLSGSSLADLQAVVSNVTSSPATVVTAKAAADGDAAVGTTFALTVNQDTLAGTGADDIFNANAVNVGGTLTDSLQSVDQVSGGNGNDTLNVTINGAAAITPTLNSIENVNVRATNAAAELDLASATGTEKVTVANSTTAANVQSVGAAALGVSNQTAAVTFGGSTSTALALNFDKVGTATTDIAVDLGTTVGNKATSFVISAKDAHVTFTEAQAGVATTAASIAATGANEITFAGADLATLKTVTLTGAGSVDLTGGALAAVTTLTAGDGGVKANVTTATAASVTATTGGGADTLTLIGAAVKAVSTGAGKDSVTASTSAIAATATVDLGAGDDTLTLGAAFVTGATLTGGDGADTIAMAVADYGTISAYTTTNLAKITGFETLSITGAALANASTVDLSKITGLTSAQILGVANGGAASITNVGANSSVVIKGNMAAAAADGALTVSLKDATGTADVINVTVNQTITQNADAVVDTTTSAITSITLTGIETVNVTSTGTLSTTVAAGAATDVAVNGLAIVNNDLVTLNVSGDQKFTFTSTAGMTKLATVNLADSTSGGTVTLTNGTIAATVTGSAKADTIVGTSKADTISGGEGADTITGAAGADTLSGGAGNDTFVYANVAHSTLVTLDTISDFTANTYGNGTSGAAGTGATATASLRTGDVIKLDITAMGFGNAAAALVDGAVVSVQSSAADAQTFLQNLGADATAALDNAVGIAFDSSTGRLYIDVDSNGTVDSVIQLTGVTTITAAAFELV